MRSSTRVSRGAAATAACLASARALASDRIADSQPARAPVPLQFTHSEPCPAPTSQPTGSTAGFLFWPSPAPPQGTIATDRPGFADTTFLVPRRHLQVELGYTHTSDSELTDGYHDHSVMQSNIRLGVLDNLELRFNWAGYSMTTSDFTSQSELSGRSFRDRDQEDGAGDMTVGFRTPWLKNDGWTPDLTFLGNLSLPVGSGNKSAGDVTPDARLAYGWALSDKLRWYGVVIGAVPQDDGNRFFQTSASTALFYAWTDRLGTFVEYYGVYPGGPAQDCSHNADGGVILLINDNCQIDFSAGIGLNEQAPDYFVGMGISFRF